MLTLRLGHATVTDLRKPLKALGRYGSAAGCKLLLDELVRYGVVLTSRYRLSTTGPMEDVYSLPLRVCRVCGCDEGNACVNEMGDPCYWSEPDLCSACASTVAIAARPAAGTAKTDPRPRPLASDR